MFASGCAASWTICAASLTSHSERSGPPVIDSRIERAPSMLVHSVVFGSRPVAAGSQELVPETFAQQALNKVAIAAAIGEMHRRDKILYTDGVQAREVNEAVGDEQPARRWRRIGDHAPVAVRGLARRPVDHVVCREVLARDRAAVLTDVVGDLLPDLAGVKRLWAILRKAVDRLTELGQQEQLTDLRHVAVGRIDRAPFGPVGQDRLEDPVQKRVHLAGRHALARRLDRGLCQLRHRDRAESRVRRVESGSRAVHAAGRRSAVELLQRAVEVHCELDLRALRRDRLRRRDEEVEQVRLAARRVDQHEAAGAETGQRALGDEAREDRRDRGVDRVAAFAQDVRPGFSGQRVTAGDGAARGQSFTPGDSVAKPIMFAAASRRVS